MFSNFISENRAVYGIILKNAIESYRPQMTIQHGAYTLHFGQFSLQTHNTHSEYNTCFFSTTTIVMPTRLNITLYLHRLSYPNSRRENERNSFDFIIIRTSSIALDRPLFFQNIFSSFLNFGFPTQCLASKYFRLGNKIQPSQFWLSCSSVTPGFSSHESVI